MTASIRSALEVMEQRIQQELARIVLIDPNDPAQDDLSQLYNDVRSGAQLSHAQAKLLLSLL